MSKSVAWSYSVLGSFETCAWRHYLTKISKQVVEPQTEATMWGNRVHKAMENRVKSATPLPDELKSYESIVARIMARPGKKEAEQRMALNAQFKPVSWFAPDVWVRGITDVTVTYEDKMFIGDWKTGKPNPESAQLKLTAAMAMHHKPQINKVVNAFIWLKDGTVTAETFTREDIPGIWQSFAPRVQRLEIAVAENKFPKKPSGLCRKWCPVPASLCEHRNG